MNLVDRITVREDERISTALEILDRGKVGILLVVDQSQRLRATVTDGDFRRALLKGIPVSGSIREVVQLRAAGGTKTPVTAALGVSKDTLLILMREHGVRQIPVLDEDGRVVDLALLDTLLTGDPTPLTAIVMAGGFGTRLGPLTAATPKPLLPVGGRPLIETILEKLRDGGVSKVKVCTHYLGELIAAHLGDGSQLGVELECIQEETPLGTAGALRLLPMGNDPILVINGDILTNFDVTALVAFHREHRAALTVGLREYFNDVPYGVAELGSSADVTRVIEKPRVRSLVLAGIYLVEPEAIRCLPRQAASLDMPQVVNELISAGKSVAGFLIHEYWRDVGKIEDYHQAQADMESGTFR